MTKLDLEDRNVFVVNATVAGIRGSIEKERAEFNEALELALDSAQDHVFSGAGFVAYVVVEVALSAGEA
jgi:hypothetical protein